VRIGQWIGLLALVLSLYILWQIRQIVLLILAAVIFATILNRIVRWLQRQGIKHGFAIAITIFLLLILVGGFFALIVPGIAEQLQQLNQLLPQAVERLQTWLGWLQNRIPGQALGRLNAVIEQLQAFSGQFVGNLFSFVTNIVTLVLSLLLFVALTIMLLVNPSQYRRVFILAFPAFYRRRVDAILSECETSLIGWIRGTLIDMAVIAVLSYIGLLVLGVPLPLVNALLAGLLEFIPNIGPVLSVIPPALLAVLAAPWKSLAVIGLYVVIQQIESLILVPIVMKQQVSLMPAFTLMAVVIFGAFFGFLGVFLSVPLLVITQIWLKNVLVEDVMSQWQAHSSQDRS